MEILTCKESIMNEINNILKAYQDNESFHREKNETLQKSLKHEELLSITLMEEIKEKDKLYWHCARAYEDRLTLGFVIPNKNFWEMMIEDIESK